MLYGLSAGGMETYHVAALNKKVKGILGMTFLDQREQQVVDETSLNLFMSRIGGPMVKLTAMTPLAGMRMPMSLQARCTSWSTTKRHSRLAWPTNLRGQLGDNEVFSHPPWLYPGGRARDFNVCPILLTQPAQATGHHCT